MRVTVAGQDVYVGTGAQGHVPGAPSICFLHGAGCDHTVWTLFARFFSRNGFNVVAPDFPGHGRSAGVPLTAVEEMADWVIRLLEALGAGAVVLAGHSLGSLVALETAARSPGSVRGLVLLGTAVPMPVGEPLLTAARDRRPAAVEMIVQFGHAFGSQLGGNPVAGIHIVNSTRRLLERGLPRNLFEDLNACNDYLGGLDAAARVQAPVTLVLGDQDRMTPPAAARGLLAALGSPDVITVPGCGHMLMAEQPESVHRALVAAAGVR